MLGTLHLTRDTYLKKDTAQAVTLADDERYPLPQGTELPVLAVGSALVDGHALVTFAQGYGPHGFNTWYVFAGHCTVAELMHPVPSDQPAPRVPDNRVRVVLPGVGAIAINDPLPGCRFFTVGEFTHGGTRIPKVGNVPRDTTPERVVQQAIALGLELDKIRDRYGVPITVNSWFRDTLTNARVGGATASQHLYGGAADVVVRGVHSRQVLRDYAHWPGGLAGTSTNAFTHFDLRGWKARWTYPF